MAGPYRVRASGPRVVENFLDVGHFPFVHEGILGDRARPEIADYDAVVSADGVLATGVKVYQPDPYATGRGSVVTYTYRVHRPLTASFIKHGEHSFGMLLSVTPHDPVDSSAWMWMAMNYEPTSEMVDFQDRIFAQDRPILESQRPELLPLDLQAELHLRSDRTAIAYRRWLRELGARGLELVLERAELRLGLARRLGGDAPAGARGGCDGVHRHGGRPRRGEL